MKYAFVLISLIIGSTVLAVDTAAITSQQQPARPRNQFISHKLSQLNSVFQWTDAAIDVTQDKQLWNQVNVGMIKLYVKATPALLLFLHGQSHGEPAKGAALALTYLSQVL